MAIRGVPRALRQVPFDLVVFHTLLLGARWRRDLFERFVRRAKPLRSMGRVRAALPQDEFLDSTSVESFCQAFDVKHLFSVISEQAWPATYPVLLADGVRLHRVLTGYLDAGTVERIQEVARGVPERDIDIGYRAWHAAPWLGRFGQLKVRVAETVESAAREAGLRGDVSTDAGDTLFGDDWLRFLLRCRYTIGVEGGASLLDRDGSLRTSTEAFLAEHPDASFDEVEAACFPGRDGEVQIQALSPRHLEACATRTCQVLVRGHYDGVLEADRHYIPLEPDLSNVGEVVASLGDEERRLELVERAWRDVVASGRYGYARFVEQVLSVAGTDVGRNESDVRARERAWRRCRRGERAAWAVVRVAWGTWSTLSSHFPGRASTSS